MGRKKKSRDYLNEKIRVEDLARPRTKKEWDLWDKRIAIECKYFPDTMMLMGSSPLYEEPLDD